MMRALRGLLATLLAMCLTAGGIASAVDDEFLGLLLETRRHVNEAIDEVLAERDAIGARIESDDWLVFPTSSGVVEVDLNDLDGYIPLAQQLLAGDPELKATVMGTLKQASPEAWEALTLLDFVGIESIPPTAISAWMRAQFGQTAGDKRRAYEDRFTKLNDEFRTLVALEREVSRELAKLRDEAAASPSPSAWPSAGSSAVPSAEPSVEPSVEPTPRPEQSLCPESDMWCDDSTGDAGIEYDALKGLTRCDEGDVACDGPAPEPDWEVSLPPTEEEVLPSLQPDGDDHVSSADFYLGDWQTDIGLLHIEKVGTKLAGILHSNAGVSQVDVVEVDERYLRADFYRPIDAPRLPGLASGPEECSEARRGTTYGGTLGLRPWGDGEVRGTWAPCDAEWQRRTHLYSTTWANDIVGTRIVEDREPAGDVPSTAGTASGPRTSENSSSPSSEVSSSAASTMVHGRASSTPG